VGTYVLLFLPNTTFFYLSKDKSSSRALSIGDWLISYYREIWLDSNPWQCEFQFTWRLLNRRLNQAWNSSLG